MGITLNGILGQRRREYFSKTRMNKEISKIVPDWVVSDKNKDTQEEMFNTWLISEQKLIKNKKSNLSARWREFIMNLKPVETKK